MKKDLKFETALKRLEEIVLALEKGADDLDKVVALYEEGMKLSDYCSTKLEKIENKIEDLSAKITQKNN